MIIHDKSVVMFISVIYIYCLNNHLFLSFLFFRVIEMLLKINQEPSSLKVHSLIPQKLLPRGACLPEQLKKHEYVAQFMVHPYSYRYILPMHSQFASFVVIKKKTETGNPIYQMFYHPSKSLVLSAQQQSMSIGCNYVISKAEVPSKNEGFVGKLRGNFQGDQFQVYDGGDNPDRIKNRPRKHLGCIKKEEGSKWLGKGEINIIYYVPKPYDTKTEIEGVSQY